MKLDPLGNGRQIIRLNQPSGWIRDVYAHLLRASWRMVLCLFVVVFLATNALFASLYLLVGAELVGVAKGSFVDTFFFSVQTYTTIGYGGMAPKGTFANVLVVIESMFGMLSVALFTGLVFSKFSRPSARILFSEEAIIATRNGKPCLMFRLANERNNRVVQASVLVTVIKEEVTEEGQRMRRMHDLKLVRETSPIFVLSWTVIHEIDQDSPLYGMTEQEMKEGDAGIFVSFTGLDDIFAQTVHAYHSYWPSRVVWGGRYVDVVERLPGGDISIDYAKFHQIVLPVASSLDLTSGWEKSLGEESLGPDSLAEAQSVEEQVAQEKEDEAEILDVEEHEGCERRPSSDTEEEPD